MPWAGPEHGVHAASVGNRWQIVVMGTPSPELSCYADEHLLIIVPIPSDECRSGLRRGAAYLLRPDGHVAHLSLDQDPEPFEAYRRSHGLDWRGGATSIAHIPAADPKDPRDRAVSSADSYSLRLIDQ